MSDAASPTPGSGPGAVARRAARSVTAPVRGYLNDHFEMVKEEVRRVGATAPSATSEPTGGTTDEAWARVAELENLLAEQSVHQARVMARVGDEMASLTDRVAELERLVRTLTELLAPPDSDGAGAA